ncbi:Alcohol dehydrogenase GroES-like domain protein [Acididesulfobacillus acetoxydans]|uniref:Alcohol dehydrogenase n=1 Tax=Acididesulfobacillus acetoxydans TaxID=1561005 RepID=A0A8S0VXU3_9FIRM|nr:alcohol dehydrogenase catalytic domain-containing protein [Acididesulfobacillus acetoxydans]CAA7602323.1 Alcohol dehydrogenase GroES-like domain protein [Acididesulfobacillus acetoxydans]CEJ08442.1 Alcohol dehydrogenase [Acididesulfobacillus acetoxydans]
MLKKTMKALVYRGPNRYGLEDVPTPQITDQNDAIGRVTLAAICTSDIHLVRGHIPNVSVPKTVGHEFCAEIVEIGSSVKRLKPGTRCVVRPAASCGTCKMCQSGMPALCEKYGIFGLGQLEGAQAEYVLIPQADRVCDPIPPGLKEEDVILVPDMLATGWFGVKNAEVNSEKTIAVVGVGPVGMSACLIAKTIFGAKKVIAIDVLSERLDILLKNHVVDIVINSGSQNVSRIIQDITNGVGVDAAIESGGIESTFELAAEITKMGGIVSTVAVFSKPLMIPMEKMFAKNLTVKMGVHRGEGISDMIGKIQEGQLDARFMLTHKKPLNDVLEGYDIFGHQKDGCVKWVITPYQTNSGT